MSNINKVVVIGAGTMGGGIAAHCANVGLHVTLLDIPATNDPKGDKNAIVKSLWDKQLKLKPSPIFTPEVPKSVKLGNLEDDIDAVIDADWIIEVIVEQLAPKQALMEKIDARRKPSGIVTSNTSGIPIHKIADGRSENFKRHFCGTHFFNPPRYLKLLEVIPSNDTDPEVVKTMQDFAENILGKNVVICKDTPNFIANRIGTFVGQHRMLTAINKGYTVEEVDTLTGELIGNPKSATFRLNDIVGFDVAMHVSKNLYDLVPNDESRELFLIPPFAQKMLDNKWLGTKTNQGFYKTVVKPDGSKEFWALNLQTSDYEPPTKPRFAVYGATKDMSLSDRFREIFGNPKWQDDRGASYIIETTLPVLAYAARRIPEIADTPREVDRAMELGFATEMGPFKIWDAIGVAHGAELMKESGIDFPKWVTEMLANGNDSFYKYEDSKLVGVYNPTTKQYTPPHRHPFAIHLSENKNTSREVKSNASASLYDIGDGVLCLEFHSKGNTIDPFIIEMIKTGNEMLQSDRWRGMVIANQGKDFSLGANIGMFIMGMGDLANLDKMAKQMQYAIWDLRFAPKPVVAAPRQRVFGGGVEMSLVASRIVASAETYMGLVEVGVGIIPGWGGCKELLRRNVSPHMTDDRVDPIAYLQKVFETIAFAKVSESGEQLRTLGFLTDKDFVYANDENLIGFAKQVTIDLANEGYTPPSKSDKSIYAIGSRGKAIMGMAIEQFRWGNYISNHDAKIARKLAHVLCGGDLTSPTWVTEDYILDLEREAALSLLGETKTQERIAYMLKNGKPLRN
jgi:3-hydroxyacyl-CoA dehydrogenase